MAHNLAVLTKPKNISRWHKDT